jgi:hypothetical protein
MELSLICHAPIREEGSCYVEILHAGWQEVVHRPQSHVHSAELCPRGWDIPYGFASAAETHPTPRSIRLTKANYPGEGLKSGAGNRTVTQRVSAGLERVSVQGKAMQCERGGHLAALGGYTRRKRYCGDPSHENIASHLGKWFRKEGSPPRETNLYHPEDTFSGCLKGPWCDTPPCRVQHLFDIKAALKGNGTRQTSSAITM